MKKWQRRLNSFGSTASVLRNAARKLSMTKFDNGLGLVGNLTSRENATQASDCQAELREINERFCSQNATWSRFSKG